jgi:hypothetical protein
MQAGLRKLIAKCQANRHLALPNLPHSGAGAVMQDLHRNTQAVREIELKPETLRMHKDTVARLVPPIPSATTHASLQLLSQDTSPEAFCKMCREKIGGAGGTPQAGDAVHTPAHGGAAVGFHICTMRM